MVTEHTREQTEATTANQTKTKRGMGYKNVRMGGTRSAAPSKLIYQLASHRNQPVQLKGEGSFSIQQRRTGIFGFGRCPTTVSGGRRARAQTQDAGLYSFGSSADVCTGSVAGVIQAGRPAKRSKDFDARCGGMVLWTISSPR